VSFRLKTIVGIAAIEAVLLLILIISSLHYLRSSNEEELRKRAYTTAQLFATTTADAVLTTDLAALESFVAQVLTNPGIVYARVRGDKIVLAEGGDPTALGRAFTPDDSIDGASDNVFDAYADIRVAGVSYGRVEVGLSVAAIQQVIAEARERTLAIAAVEMGLVALFSFGLGLYLTRGLNALTTASQRIAEGELGYEVPVRGRDELARTASAFNTMSRRLLETARERERAEEEIRGLNQRLEERVRERTEELAALNKQLQHQALHDPLTKLPNRTLFQDRLDHAVRLGLREKKPFALIVLDLDRFKEINDTKGHATGDLVLQHSAASLRAALRDSDTVARMGGDEFAILLPGVAGWDTAHVAAQRVLQSLTRPFPIAGDLFEVGASLGVALFPKDGEDAETLERRADGAMYHAKYTREGIAFYRPELEQASQQRQSLTGELRHAIENHHLVLHYQPKIDFATRRVSAVEALVRWQHPRRGLLYPDSFIPLAEETGLIKPLTLAVIRMAVRECADWRERGIELVVAVNISAHNVQDETFPERVAAILEELRVPPEWLELEITETGIMTNPVLSIETITRLSGMGIQIAIDDFGTGYSSMAYLKKLLVAKIKIDKSFVMDMATDANDAVIVRSTIDLGHNLGLKVVAEGVEDETAWERLQQLGCDAAQGYYMSRPLPAKELLDWLRQSPWGLRSAP